MSARSSLAHYTPDNIESKRILGGNESVRDLRRNHATHQRSDWDLRHVINSRSTSIGNLLPGILKETHYPVGNFTDIPTELKQRVESANEAPLSTQSEMGTNEAFGTFDKWAQHETTRVFVAFAIYLRNGLSGAKSSRVYNQDFIAYARCKIELNTSVQQFIEHKMESTADAQRCDDMRIVMVSMDFHDSVIPQSIAPHSWEHIAATSDAERVLHKIKNTLEYKHACIDLKEARRSAEIAERIGSSDTFMSAFDRAKMAAWEKHLARQKRPEGKVVWEALYKPSTNQTQAGSLRLELESIVDAEHDIQKAIDLSEAQATLCHCCK